MQRLVAQRDWSTWSSPARGDRAGELSGGTAAGATAAVDHPAPNRRFGRPRGSGSDRHAVAAPKSHPAGCIRLGVETPSQRPFDVAVPDGTARHVTLLGLTGSGKTTTAERLAEGAVACGSALVVVDAKGAGLREAVRRLAEARGLEHREVVPGAAGTLGYNPCALGSRAQIADKLVSALTHGPSGQVYA